MNTVVLENTHGATVARAEQVPNNDLVGCVAKFMGAARNYAAPVVFVNGTGYTSLLGFMRMVHTVNEFSTRAGGSQVY